MKAARNPGYALRTVAGEHTSLWSVLAVGLLSMAAIKAAPTHPATERLDDLHQLSMTLIERAASGTSPASQFRIEARIYRELLRRVTLDDRAQAPARRLPKTLLLDMVRMSALLHAAADCKTGFVITCPPDLMRQLRAQQARVDHEMTLYRLVPDRRM